MVINLSGRGDKDIPQVGGYPAAGRRSDGLTARSLHLSLLGRGRLRSSRVRGLSHSIRPKCFLDHFKPALKIITYTSMLDTRTTRKPQRLQDLGAGFVSCYL